LFKKIYGRTPHKYLTFVRLEKAKLLLKLNASVDTVCFETGFESPTSFASLFKKIYGKTPSDYRAEHAKYLRESRTTPLKFIPGCVISKFDLDN
jgi:AraC-like DNA-binding protein